MDNLEEAKTIIEALMLGICGLVAWIIKLRRKKQN